MAGRLVLLGTGTCRLDDGRVASAVLVELDDLRLVFDFGRGVARRLAELGLRQDDVGQVMLSHFHPDHFSDLIPYLHAGLWSPTDPRSRDLAVHGPHGLERLLSDLLDLVGFSDLDAPAPFAVHAYSRGEGELRLGGHQLEVRHLPPAGNLGLRFRAGSRVVALTGDSHFHDREVEFLRGAELAVVDAGHLTDDELVHLAAASGVGRMVCSHLYGDLDGGALTAAAAALGFAGSILVGEDLMSFEL